MNSRLLLEQAHTSAALAVQADGTGDYYPASLLYLEAYELVENAIRFDPSLEGTHRPTASSYLARAEALRQIMVRTDRECISVVYLERMRMVWSLWFRRWKSTCF